MEAIAQQIALINVHQMAIDVNKNAMGTLNAAEAEAAIEEWLEGSEAPIAFAVQAEALEEEGNLEAAFDIFFALSSHRDAADRAQALADRLGISLPNEKPLY